MTIYYFDTASGRKSWASREFSGDAAAMEYAQKNGYDICYKESDTADGRRLSPSGREKAQLYEDGANIRAGRSVSKQSKFEIVFIIGCVISYWIGWWAGRIH